MDTLTAWTVFGLLTLAIIFLCLTVIGQSMYLIKARDFIRSTQALLEDGTAIIQKTLAELEALRQQNADLLRRWKDYSAEVEACTAEMGDELARLQEHNAKLAPNLDGMYPDDLEALRRDHRAMVDYINATLSARSNRASGEIDKALHFEKQADAIYQRLPAHYRW